MNNLLKDFKIQPTKLRGENMKEENIITEFIQTPIGFTLSKCDLTTGKVIVNNIEITSIEDWEKVTKSIFELQQELTNLKAIEKEHQRMNGELREEVKGYQQMYFDKVLIINKALTKIDNMFNKGDEFTIIDDLLELDKILKGDKHEQ